MMATTPTAAISPHRISCPPTRLGTMIVSVRTSLRVNNSANMNSFQVKMKDSSAVTTRPGATSGSAMRRNALKMVAPSTRAASSSSAGRSSKKPFSSQMANGRLNTVLAMINPKWVSSRWSERNNRNKGSALATGGNIRVDSTQNDRFGPPVRYRANEYAAGAPSSKDTAIDPEDQIKLSR